MSFWVIFAIGVTTGCLFNWRLDQIQQRRRATKYTLILHEGPMQKMVPKAKEAPEIRQIPPTPQPHVEAAVPPPASEFPIVTKQRLPISWPGFIRRVLVTTLIAATGLIHLRMGFEENQLIFTLNGLGYVVLLLFYLLPWTTSTALLRTSLITYTSLTIIAYFYIHGNASFTYQLGLVTKLIEILIIILVLMRDRRRLGEDLT